MPDGISKIILWCFSLLTTLIIIQIVQLLLVDISFLFNFLNNTVSVQISNSLMIFTQILKIEQMTILIKEFTVIICIFEFFWVVIANI
jgi:hypothetical protein